MEKQQNLQLLHGKFSVQETKEILIALFTDKIRFHEKRQFSMMERTGVHDTFSEQRIKELRQTVKQLLVQFDELEKDDVEITLDSSIQMAIRERAF